MRPQDLIRTVAFEYGVMPEELLGPRKTPWLTKARWEIYEILSKMGMSSNDIGRLFNRDHTTILYALKKKRAVDN